MGSGSRQCDCGILADASASQEAAVKPGRFRIRFGAGWSANDGRAAEACGGIDLIAPANFLNGTQVYSIAPNRLPKNPGKDVDMLEAVTIFVSCRANHRSIERVDGGLGSKAHQRVNCQPPQRVATVQMLADRDQRHLSRGVRAQHRKFLHRCRSCG